MLATHQGLHNKIHELINLLMHEQDHGQAKSEVYFHRNIIYFERKKKPNVTEI